MIPHRNQNCRLSACTVHCRMLWSPSSIVSMRDVRCCFMEATKVRKQNQPSICSITKRQLWRDTIVTICHFCVVNNRVWILKLREELSPLQRDFSKIYNLETLSLWATRQAYLLRLLQIIHKLKFDLCLVPSFHYQRKAYQTLWGNYPLLRFTSSARTRYQVQPSTWFFFYHLQFMLRSGNLISGSCNLILLSAL